MSLWNKYSQRRLWWRCDRALQLWSWTWRSSLETVLLSPPSPSYSETDPDRRRDRSYFSHGFSWSDQGGEMYFKQVGINNHGWLWQTEPPVDRSNVSLFTSTSQSWEMFGCHQQNCRLCVFNFFFLRITKFHFSNIILTVQNKGEKKYIKWTQLCYFSSEVLTIPQFYLMTQLLILYAILYCSIVYD